MRWQGVRSLAPCLGLLLAVLLAVGVACNHTDDVVARLTIQDHGLGAWIATNNQFAEPAVDNCWTGVLLQIGDIPVPGVHKFQMIKFSKAGASVGTPINRVDFENGKQFWVNIVARGPDAEHTDPMKPEDVLVLLPGPPLSSDPCPEITGVNENCMRKRKLHAQMESVIGVVTCWQGAKGYKMTSLPDLTGRFCKFEFGLKDEVKVEIYTIDGSNMSLASSFDYGGVDLIEVVSVIPPGDGNKQDPPWPK